MKKRLLFRRRLIAAAANFRQAQNHLRRRQRPGEYFIKSESDQ